MKKFPRDKTARKRYLPIKPSARHPDNDIQLKLSGKGDKLPKDSYINTGTVLTTKLEALRPFKTPAQRHFELSKSSYEKLIETAKYTAKHSAPAQPQTRIVPVSEDSERRLRDMLYHRAFQSTSGMPAGGWTPGVVRLPGSLHDGHRIPQLQRQWAIPAVSRGTVVEQSRHDERTSLLPYHHMQNRVANQRPRRYFPPICRIYTDASFLNLSGVEWRKLLWIVVRLAIFIGLWYGIYWLGVKAVQSILAGWQWLENHVNSLATTIKDWFTTLFGQVDSLATTIKDWFTTLLGQVNSLATTIKDWFMTLLGQGQ
ncbi:hypothetical protein QQS21_012189 [Conoideocrella luteorostrata]|uniref:Uncharacterized protein n=1 Tax=Conoideocrella luteorostrata TaxID=1105319 RepID=A0AAJ0CG69_9HYPO|nr:hypothetical protein QQS21_012189 [Conoideocrella luteorostrata]